MRLANQDWDLSLMEGITVIFLSISQISMEGFPCRIRRHISCSDADNSYQVNCHLFLRYMAKYYMDNVSSGTLSYRFKNLFHIFE